MIRKLGIFLLLAIYFLIVYTLFAYLGISCVFLELTGLPCPGCGMTRAFISILKADLAAAVRYNITVFFMPYVFAYIFFDLKGRIHNILLLLIAIIAIINWVTKIILII